MAISIIIQGDRDRYEWDRQLEVPRKSWKCGYCGNTVSSDRGYRCRDRRTNTPKLTIRTCSGCLLPTVFLEPDGDYRPRPKPGREVKNVPEPISTLYDEARESAGAGAPTAAVMACRVILSHIAVLRGAKSRGTFDEHIDHLESLNYFSPEGLGLAKYVKRLGSDANHKTKVMSDEDAKKSIAMVESLLIHIFELHSQVPEEFRTELPEPDDDPEDS